MLWRPVTLSLRRSLSQKNQSTDLLSKSIDWFLYDRDLRHERVKKLAKKAQTQSYCDFRTGSEEVNQSPKAAI